MEVKSTEPAEVFFSREISSIVIDLNSIEAFPGITIYADNQNFTVSSDADVDLENGMFRSNIIIFSKPVSSIKIKSATDENIKIHALYAEPLSYQAPQKQLRLRTEPCEKPVTVDQETWRKDLPGPKVIPSSNIVKHVIVHHTATSNSDTDYVKSMRNIYLYHTEVNGWDDIGYNFLIATDGTIFQGRDGQGAVEDDNALGAHFCAKNRGTMGISMIGTFTEIPPTDTALRSLQHLTAWKLNQENLYALDSALHPENSPQGYYLDRISGHRDGCATECPGDSLYALLGEIRAEVFFLMKNCTPPLVSVFHQHKIENNLKVYPQPARDILYMKLQKNASEPVDFVINNVLGKQMQTGKIQAKNNQVNISDLPKGFYLLSIYDGTEKCFIRFIKQ